MLLQTTLLVAVLGSSVAPAAVTSAPAAALQCPADPELAALLAASDLVLLGKMDVPKQRLADEARKASPEYLDIPLQVEGAVKGGSVGSVTIRFYPQDAAYKPSIERCSALRVNRRCCSSRAWMRVRLAYISRATRQTPCSAQLT
jgi:hypothetical protein